MSKIANQELYDKVKKQIYAKYPVHSAYRSGLLVKTYKEQGGKYIGKENKSSGLNRWFKEKWVNSRVEVGYKNKSDVYRPTVRVSKDTPTTFKELTKEQIEKAKAAKTKTGRVQKFDKSYKNKTKINLII